MDSETSIVIISILWIIITIVFHLNREKIKKKIAAEEAKMGKTQPTKSRRVKKVFVGSWGVFTVWLILFFPVAIIYYFSNVEKEE